MILFRTKSLKQLQAEAGEEGTHTLKRTLGSGTLLALGVGAIIGAGIFVRTASAAGNYAGPGVMWSYVIAALGCAFAGLCYVEFAAMIPIAGSAYTYSYATMGELIAWVIGWDLVLEYALGAATVAIAWSEYLNKLCQSFLGFTIPYAYCHSPFQASLTTGEHGLINLPAIFILSVLTLVLIRGTKESATLNNIIVAVKVTIVIFFVILGWKFINPVNHAVIVPPNEGGDAFGWQGVFRGAGIVFFAYVGFDAVSTAAQEAKDPQKGMPIGILGSLAFCTILYILFSYVLTGIANYKDFSNVGAGHEAAVAYAISTYMPGYSWFSNLITIAVLAGFSSVILVMLLGQARVFYSMANDGLLPKMFSEVHPRFRTPAKANLLLFAFVSIFAAFIPGDIVGEMTSIGTLFAFVLVSIGIIIMRKTNPSAARPFRTPFVPVVPLLGVAVCFFMIYHLGWENWTRLIVWLELGFLIYFAYGIKKSKLGNGTYNHKLSTIGFGVSLASLVVTAVVIYQLGLMGN